MKQIGSIQILRALAALMVVFAHAQSDAFYEALKAGLTFTKNHALPWDAGVDLFFVISGFIMIYASERLFEQPGAPSHFFGRRLIRIVPLYWIVTVIALMGSAIAVLHGKEAVPSLARIAASFGFIPFNNAEGEPSPIAPQGWTLNYEMVFYVIFAVFILFRQTIAVVRVTMTLLVMVELGVLFVPTQTALAHWSDPIILEFAIGMWIAVVRQRGWSTPPWVVGPCLIVGLAVMSLDLRDTAQLPNFVMPPNGFPRLVGCGFPMALIFAAVVLAKPVIAFKGRVWAFLCFLGDASYALYLFHFLAIIFVRKAYIALGLVGPLGLWPLVFLEVPASVLLALVVHVLVEGPLTSALQARFFGKRTLSPSLKHAIPSTR